MAVEGRVGVVSDSHGRTATLRQALKDMGPVDYIIHAGDHVRDAQALSAYTEAVLISVPGNCDPHVGPIDELVELFGHRFYITHGHTLGVKMGTAELISAAHRRQARVAVFGHTHVPALFVCRGILAVNPGSTAFPRQQSRPGCAVITIRESEVTAELISLSQ